MHFKQAKNILHFKWPRLVYLVACLLATTGAPEAIEEASSQKMDASSASTASSVSTASGASTASTAASDQNSTAISDPTEMNLAKKNEIIYKLLVAELARSRHLKSVALKNALESTQMSQDPTIASYTTELAIVFQEPGPAIESAEIWAKNDKNDIQAQMVAATLLIGQSTERAIPYLTQAIALDPILVNQHLSAIQSRLSEKSAEHLKIALQTIAKTNAKDPHAQLIAAQSTAQQGDIPKANQWVDDALKLNPQLTPAIQLKARLIRYEDTSDARALKYLSDKVAKYPKNAELRLFLASALMDANRLQEAMTHLNKITQDTNYGGKANLYIGEIYLVGKNIQKSKEYLLKAVTHKEVADNARLDLGDLAIAQNKREEALVWYTSVNPGSFHVPAVLKAVSILKREKAFPEAMRIIRDATPTTIEEQKKLLLIEVDIMMASNQMEDATALSEDLLSKLPDDVDILYTHSMVASRLKQWKIAENDLKNILRIDPNYGDALNALSFLLSFQKERLQEAEGYANQALRIKPKNPSYLDSMGWIQYKMGNYKTAIQYLEQAYDLSKDPEIAVHLGEVLWVAGKKNEALGFWTNAYKQDPANAMLIETVQRLKIDNAMLKFTKLKEEETAKMDTRENTE